MKELTIGEMEGVRLVELHGEKLILRHDYIEFYWNDYLAHEERFLNLTRYVDISRQNYFTCSQEILSQLLSVCSSLESTFKLLCSLNGKSCDSYPGYIEVLESCPLFNYDEGVRTLRGKARIDLQPFSGASKGRAPFWWTAHNKIKHDKGKHYFEAKFICLLSALAALYYINCLIIKMNADRFYNVYLEKREAGKLSKDVIPTRNCIDVPNDTSRLFELKHFETRRHVGSFEQYDISKEEIDIMFDS